MKASPVKEVKNVKSVKELGKKFIPNPPSVVLRPLSHVGSILEDLHSYPRYVTLEDMSDLELLPISAEQALFEGHIQGLAAVFCQNERPPQGLLGLLDWYFQGLISYSIRTGAIGGQPGECAYFPLRKGNTTYPLLVIGAGPSSEPGLRTEPLIADLQKLQRNVTALKIPRFGLSRSDLGGIAPENLAKTFSCENGVSFCLAQ